MIIMRATETIIKMAKENHGTVTTAMVVAAGFSRGNIKSNNFWENSWYKEGEI